ncbi:MAG: TetR/AcrR family transcriptional regulator C-terminal domain-containing protein [Erysipelotrichaceae bacterium]|nr:TetR/AcrR family transcriptional regulator C-terminal domain-containing protein [Erysipelotrichaceae bacterium]MDY5251494.1 TetR/AcrR family transcriptional regulator C-terminal domain-containing protein [Erysipelotrichaceae bacterium]
MSSSSFTKQMIAQGTKHLVQTMDIEKITVKDIINYCEIARNTFYYHFKDKYDVINWIFYSEITPIIGENHAIDNWSASLLSLCHYLQDNKAFYIKVLNLQGQNSFTECLMDFYVNLVKDLLINAHADKILDSNQIQIIANFYAFGLTGVIANWAKNGMQTDPQAAIQILEDLLSGDIFNTIIATNK